ncbi:MAG: SGNH/GDSL hydrolase family protein, partial [Chloroflexi bacterium]|nr:SGNH/GDSL hydrolase family protein [Chloroflexota bacterium]
RTATSSTGWVLASQIKVLLPNVKSLAIMSAGLPAGPRPAPLPAHSPAGPLENVNIGKLRAIFQKGQKLGNRARVFSKIGDSSVRDQQFLYGFGLNKQTLGPYSYLQATIDFFSIPARPGFANSFVNESLAAVPAFNAAAAFDASWTSWTDPNKVCSAEEGPLDCELRVVQPSILIIKLGLEDMFVLTPDEYRTYLHQIVLHTMERGTIPLLCTFASNPHESKYPHAGENAVKLNQVIREIAAAEQIPLLELREPVMRLPDLGLNPEGIHVSDWAGDPYNFSGDQERWGITLVNLLTLQMLDRLRVEVLAR